MREVYRGAVAANRATKAEQDLLDWRSWARRCRREPIKRLANMVCRLRSIPTRNGIKP
ncbi:hypothetical protein [Rugamonas sp. DEMB1]|uniref:hypothetical protein n=1 Tax=Rugamonas sp. DEMB1 TaxID=3039386 RepID=UPI00391B75C8